MLSCSLYYRHQISPEENDGVKLFSVLRELTTPEDIRDILGSIEGPQVSSIDANNSTY